MKQKRRRSRIPILVLAVLLIGLAVTAYVQRNNLHAFLMSMQYSEEELIALQEQHLKDLLTEYDLDIVPRTDDESDSAVVVSPGDNTAPEPDVKEPVPPGSEDTQDPLPESEAETTGQQNRPETTSKDTQKSPAKALPKDVQDLVYSLYSLQSQYIGKLDGIAASTRTRFDALPSEKRNGTTRASMVRATLSQAISLESQCDGRVASIIRELRAALKKHGMDDSVADNAEHYYATQKGLLKAEYMRKYNKYLK